MSSSTTPNLPPPSSQDKQGSKIGAPPLTTVHRERANKAIFLEAKLHDESKMIQWCFDDNNDDNKRS